MIVVSDTSPLHYLILMEQVHLQPHYFGLKEYRTFMFAGLWQTWNKSDPPLESCVILATQANELLGELHDRMPVILSTNDWATWLDPDK